MTGSKNLKNKHMYPSLTAIFTVLVPKLEDEPSAV